MIFNGQGDDLQRIGGKPSVTWTLKLETRVTEGLLGTPPALARLCATVRTGGGWMAHMAVAEAENSEQYTRSVSGYNSCQRVSQRVNAAIQAFDPFCPLAATRVLGFLNSDALGFLNSDAGE